LELLILTVFPIQCFDAVGWATGRASDRGGSRRWSWGQSGDLGDGRPPVGSRGEALAKDLGTKSPRSWSIFESTQPKI